METPKRVLASAPWFIARLVSPMCQRCPLSMSSWIRGSEQSAQRLIESEAEWALFIYSQVPFPEGFYFFFFFKDIYKNNTTLYIFSTYRALVLKQKLYFLSVLFCFFFLKGKQREEKPCNEVWRTLTWEPVQLVLNSDFVLHIGSLYQPLKLYLFMCKRQRYGGTVYGFLQFPDTMSIEPSVFCTFLEL